MKMYRRTFAEIDLRALSHNWEVLNRGGRSFICPMVKANAYGHGDVQVTRHLETLGAKRVGVCLIEEGLLLREFGVRCQILVFRGFDREGARAMIANDLTPVVSSWEHIEALETSAKRPLEIHLKFDTGMNRLGFRVDEAEKAFDRLNKHPLLRVKALVTHLFQGEDADRQDGHSARQLKALSGVVSIFQTLNPEVHALNSSGLLHRLRLESGPADAGHPLFLQDWGFRPGLASYGVNPLAENREGLRPVMSLKSSVATFRTLAPGETVSYNGTWKAKRDSVIAVVPIGYADGYHRILSNKAEALFAGHRVPVVGNICMDYLMLDVTEAVQMAQPKPGEEHEVVFFGRDSDGKAVLPIEEVATKAGTITWEVLTSVGERVPRVYLGGSAS